MTSLVEAVLNLLTSPISRRLARAHSVDTDFGELQMKEFSKVQGKAGSNESNGNTPWFEEYVRTKMYDLRREFGIRLDCQMVNTYGQ